MAGQPTEKVEDPYIVFNIGMIVALKDRYEKNIAFLKTQLPDVNWNSRVATRRFFEEKLGIFLENVTISHLETYLALLDHDSTDFDVINGLVLYLKQKYTISNYLDCILRHHENGRVNLRHHEGAWVLPNKRPLTTSPEIQECIVHSTTKKGATSHGSYIHQRRKH